MKKLTLENQSFKYLEQSFREWLDVLGYAPATVYNMPNLIRELFYYLELQAVTNIKNLDVHHIQSYYPTLKERGNQRRGGGLSNAHLNKHIQALRKFIQYLRKVGRLQIPEIKLENEETENKLTYLTEEEIKELFAATQKATSDQNKSMEIVKAIQARDRAMLAIFYGCGLRRNEGVHLDIGDINFDRSILHVRKGKNYKERLVPISKANLKYLTEYLYDHRPELTKGSKTEALFIGYTNAKRMQGQSLTIRLRVLQYHTENIELQEKEIGLHMLRHSIATHFLQAGMKLESISRFLGHSSLESTQIYTHLAEMPPIGVLRTLEKAQPTATSAGQAFNNLKKYETIQLSEDER